MNRILIVEDNINVRTGLEKIIKEVDRNIIIFQTGSAEEAYNILTENKIDAFLLDVNIEDYSGIELSERIRTFSVYKFTPIVFITGDYDSRVEAFVRSSCCDYILKPFKKSDVVKAVEDIINYGIWKKESEKPLLIVDKGITYLIEENSILYLEYSSRSLKIITKREDYNFAYYSLTKVRKLLSDRFIQCHKSFIINQEKLSKVDLRKSQLFIADEVNPIPIGRKYKTVIKEIINDIF